MFQHLERRLSLPTLRSIIQRVTLRYVASLEKDRPGPDFNFQINPFSITPLGPEPPILREDEEVPAVKWALIQRK